MEFPAHLDWKFKLLGEISRKTKREPSVLRGQDLKLVLKERRCDFLTSKKFDEVCYKYSDNAGKEYCFVNTLSFEEYLLKSINYTQRYFESIQKIDELIRLGTIERTYKEYFNEGISVLKYDNADPFEELSDFQKINITKLLSKQFLNQTLCLQQ